MVRRRIKRCIAQRCEYEWNRSKSGCVSYLRFEFLFFFSSRRRHTRFDCDWSSDVCSSDLVVDADEGPVRRDGDDVEFWKIYKLDVIAIPTNRPLIRVNYPDVIFRSEREKWEIGRASCRERV